MSATSAALQAWLFRPGPTAWVQRVIGPGHTVPFQAVDQLATAWGALFALGLALWLWGRADAYALAGALVLEALVNLALNELFSVPRPSAPAVIVYEPVKLGSFPSGHVFTATVIWGLFWLRGRVPWWVSAPIVLAVGTARLYMGSHYLTDVVGGVLAGAALLWIFPKIWRPVRAWLAERSFRFFVACAALGLAAVGAGLFLFFGSNRFLWTTAGVFAGGALALPLEYRWIRYTPEGLSRGRAAGAVFLGLVVIVPLLLLDRAAGTDALALGMGLAFAATLWSLLAVPWLALRGRPTNGGTR